MLVGISGLMMISCAEDYDVTIPVPDMPYEAEMDARLSSYDVLTSYLAANPGMKIGASVDIADYDAHELTYSIVHTNFNQIEAYGQLYPSALLNTETGVYDFSKLTTIVEDAQKDGVSLFGPVLCSRNNIPSAYLKSLVDPVIIPYEPWSEEKMVADFEADAVGTKYPSSKKAVGKAAVSVTEDPQQGKVLTGTNLTLEIPKIEKITLPAGVTLADVSRVTVKCLRAAGGTATGSRIQIENAGYTEKANPHNTIGEWVEFVFDLKNLKLSASQLALNSFSLCAGVYGSRVSFSIDEVTLKIEHATGDDTVIEKTPEEKTEIINGEMKKWVEGVVGVTGETVNDFIIYDEPLDDEGASFNWADYLGDNYVAQAQAMASAVVPNAKYYVSQSLVLDEMTADNIDAVIAAVKALEAKGVRVDGVNLALSTSFYEDYRTQAQHDQVAVEAMKKLASIGKPVRVANFAVQVLDKDGRLINPSVLSIVERQAVSEFYQKVLGAYVSSLGTNAAGFSLAKVRDDATNVAPWASNGNRNFIYEGIVKAFGK